MALTGETFDAFLSALAADRHAAGERYESLRRRLLIFFAARRCGPADEFADEVLDRTARRVAEGIKISPSIESFVLGVARNLVREQWKKPQAAEVDWNRVAAAAAVEEDGHARCLDTCLDRLTPRVRDWIERFYRHQGIAKIRERQTLAGEMGVDANALRVRMHRLRGKLENCVRACLEGNELAAGAIFERE